MMYSTGLSTYTLPTGQQLSFMKNYNVCSKIIKCRVEKMRQFITDFVCTGARCGDAVRQPDTDSIRCLCNTTSINENITDAMVGPTAVVDSWEMMQ